LKFFWFFLNLFYFIISLTSKFYSKSNFKLTIWWFYSCVKLISAFINISSSSPYETDEKKAGCINYTCKKCNLIFQRYYELIRHQKNHCFKEENNKKSAKAQIAAAQIAQSLSSEDSNSSLEINHASNLLGNNLLQPPQLLPKQSQLASNSIQNLPKLTNHPSVNNLLTNQTSATTTTTTSVMVNATSQSTNS
jgi:zinc finger homeobox protein 4